MTFKYEVEWFEETEERSLKECGFGVANSFIEAMQKIIYNFGADAITDVRIVWLDEDDLMSYDRLMASLCEQLNEQDNRESTFERQEAFQQLQELI